MLKKPIHNKLKIQIIIVCTSFLLLIAKFTAYFITNSVGVYTDAMESIVNVVAGIISLLSISHSLKPRDESHPFGHGKIELLSASLEGIMIITAGAIIIYESVKRFISPSEIGSLDIGIWIVAAAGLINYIMGYVSIKEGRKYNSEALIASGKHLQSDTYSTIGLVAGLLLVYFTKINLLDSLLGLIFGAIIIVTGIKIIKSSFDFLMDKADKKKLEALLESVKKNMKDDWIDIHNLKIIRYGSGFYLDCDMTLPAFYTIEEGHKATEELKAIIQKELGEDVLFSIHLDPCKDYQCIGCLMSDCDIRNDNFVERLPLTLHKMISSENTDYED